jgi:hypothetical protein
MGIRESVDQPPDSEAIHFRCPILGSHTRNRLTASLATGSNG